MRLWLNGLSPHTQRNYRRYFKQFRAFCPIPIDQITLSDILAFKEHVEAMPIADGSKHFVLAAIKSFFQFVTVKLRLLPVDVAAPLRMSGVKETLGERIMSEEEVERLIIAAKPGRDRIILEMLYYTGMRRAELVGLTWADATPRDDVEGMGGQLKLFGKGKKTRTVLIPIATWAKLLALRPSSPAAAVGSADPNAADGDGRSKIFAITSGQVYRIVKSAARAAHCSPQASPHWLRHCNASHALDRGCKIHVVQQQLGHASLATTSRYLHARPKESSAAFLRPPRPM